MKNDRCFWARATIVPKCFIELVQCRQWRATQRGNSALDAIGLAHCNYSAWRRQNTRPRNCSASWCHLKGRRKVTNFTYDQLYRALIGCAKPPHRRISTNRPKNVCIELEMVKWALERDAPNEIFAKTADVLWSEASNWLLNNRLDPVCKRIRHSNCPVSNMSIAVTQTHPI